MSFDEEITISPHSPNNKKKSSKEEKEEIKKQISNWKRIEINKYKYFSLPYPPNRNKILKVKYFDYGAHFKYMDLFYKLANQVLILPPDRLPPKGNFIQIDKEKTDSIYTNYYKFMNRNKTKKFKSLLHSMKDFSSSSLNLKPSSSVWNIYNSNSSSNGFKFFDNSSCFNSNKSNSKNPIKLYKSTFNEQFFKDSNKNKSTFNSRIWSAKIPQRPKSSMPYIKNEENNSNKFNKLKIRRQFLKSAHPNNNRTHLNLFKNLSTGNLFTPLRKEGSRKNIHIFGNKQIKGDPKKMLELDLRPFIKVNH